MDSRADCIACDSFDEHLHDLITPHRYFLIWETYAKQALESIEGLHVVFVTILVARTELLLNMNHAGSRSEPSRKECENFLFGVPFGLGLVGDPNLPRGVALACVSSKCRFISIIQPSEVPSRVALYFVGLLFFLFGR